MSGAHGWSGRDLMAHLVAWQLVTLDIAKELAVGEKSADGGARRSRLESARRGGRQRRDPGPMGGEAAGRRP